MKLAIDISQIVYKGTGVARFTQGLVEAILKAPPSHEWVFFFSSLRGEIDPKLKQKIEKTGHILFEYRLPPSALSFLWNRLHILRVEHLIKGLDWFITSDWTEAPTRHKKATIVHDLAFVTYPETVAPAIRATQTMRLKWVAKESTLIFADSRSTTDDLATFYQIPEKRMQVNYPGVAVRKPSAAAIKAVRKKFNLHRPFILTVGKVEPRKNVPRLIEAYESLKTEAELVIAGPRGWDPVYTANPRIKFLDFVADDDLFALYGAAEFFVYPSLYEGFGYPVVEAMSLGAAVATSHTSSLGEIGKDAALLFDPLNADDIALSMQKLLTDRTLRVKLARAGRAKSKRFTWDNYYRTFISALEAHS